MSSLSNAGKISLGGSETASVDQLAGSASYEEKIRAKEKEFVSEKSIRWLM
jgi:hypothetical protein